MSRALIIRSIPLSSTTRNAWKANGAVFSRRERTYTREIEAIAGGRPIINLGNSSMDIEGSWNNAPVVRPLLTPIGTRELMPHLLPTNEWAGEGYYWLKGQGRGGANKEKVYVTNKASHDVMLDRANWMKGDVQQNIGGTEYRAITVGTKVVQGMKRIDTGGDREYEWTGSSGLPRNIRMLAKKAAEMMGDEKTIIGWDLIDSDEGAFVLEGNSCPGVNEATAARILDAVEGVRYAA